MNVAALAAVAVFAGVLLAVVGAIYAGAVRSHRRGELDASGIRMLRWALLGHLVLDALLALAAILAPP